MTLASNIEFTKKLIEKLKENIIKGKWKFEVLKDYEEEHSGSHKIGKAELIKEVDDLDESQTFVTFEVSSYESGDYFFERYELLYKKHDRVVSEFSCDRLYHENPDSFEEYELYELIKNAVDELKAAQLEYMVNTIDTE